jgi:hypothetical protein
MDDPRSGRTRVKLSQADMVMLVEQILESAR